MKKLALEDLSREELLAWIGHSVLPRAIFGEPVRQADLLSVRHETLQAKKTAASDRWIIACGNQARAMQAWLACNGDHREKNKLERIYLDLKDAADRAERTRKRAERERDACWAAMEAEWERAR